MRSLGQNLRDPRLGRPARDDQGDFQGSLNQFVAITLVIDARNALEDVHAGFYAPPTARVRTGDQIYKVQDMARFDPEWVRSFSQRFAREASENAMKIARGFRGNDENYLNKVLFKFSYASKWVLPEEEPSYVADIMPIVTTAVFRASGTKRPLRDRSYRILKQDTFIKDYLAPATIGIPPGDDAMIETTSGWRPWKEASMLSDPEMQGFNIGLSDRVYSILEAMDRAHFDA
jgi:hypothetical protein